jgi:hypothetical protein
MMAADRLIRLLKSFSCMACVAFVAFSSCMLCKAAGDNPTGPAADNWDILAVFVDGV